MRFHQLVAIASIAKEAHSFSPRAVAELQRHAMLSTRSTQLLGDLVGDNNLTESGMQISRILQGNDTALGNTDTYQAPDTQDSQRCHDDECCKYSYAVKTMQQAFDGCNDLARQAIRLGFHDASAWNLSQTTGGADGSVVLNDQEAARLENKGLQDIIGQMKSWYSQQQKYGVGMADMIQLGAMTATVLCPGGPRVRAYVGRDDSDDLPPEGLIPSPFAGAEANIQLFEAKSFSATDLVALVGAHTVSQQKFVDPAQAGKTEDTTDTVWDTQFYVQTQSPDTPNGVFKFPSDLALSNNSATTTVWQTFARDKDGWDTAFASAYFRMSVLGVKNLNNLTDCTKVLPNSQGARHGGGGNYGGNGNGDGKGGGKRGSNQQGGPTGGDQGGDYPGGDAPGGPGGPSGPNGPGGPSGPGGPHGPNGAGGPGGAGGPPGYQGPQGASGS